MKNTHSYSHFCEYKEKHFPLLLATEREEKKGKRKLTIHFCQMTSLFLTQSRSCDSIHQLASEGCVCNSDEDHMTMYTHRERELERESNILTFVLSSTAAVVALKLLNLSLSLSLSLFSPLTRCNLTKNEG